MAHVHRFTNLAGAKVDEHAVAAALTANDPKHKKFAQQIDKCLSTFENVHDWADCTAFLTRLLKTLQSFTQFRDIPQKAILAKRLSQCLNPALPSGVHQRVLDIYGHILAVLGTDGLRRDLHVWSLGLLPFFEYAATSLKSSVLDLYETHYLPLGNNIRVLLRAFILALLPGLEDETSEHFERVLTIFDEVLRIVSSAQFYQNMWLIMLTAPSARAPALNLLSKRLPKFKDNEDITVATGRDVGLMLRAFASVLEDQNLLVRRSSFDVLIRSLQLDGLAMKRAQLDDRMTLVRAAAGVVLRRDLSLNRRLFAWLLGPSESSDLQIAFFNAHSLDVLVRALRSDMIKSKSSEGGSTPWKVFFALLDKWEIGALLTETLICDALRIAKDYHLADSTKDSELLATISNLYDAIQPWALWKQLFGFVYSNLQAASEVEGIRTTTFVLENLLADEQEAQNVHLPIIFAAISEFVEDRIKHQEQDGISLTIREAISLLRAMAPHIPANILRNSAEIKTDKVSRRPSSCLHQAKLLYNVALEQDETEASARGSSLPLLLSVPFQLLFSSFTNPHTQTKAPKSTTTSCDKALRHEIVLLHIALLEQSNQPDRPRLPLSWPSAEFLDLLMQQMDFLSFEELESVLNLCELIEGGVESQPPFTFHHDQTLKRILQVLLRFLDRQWSLHHVQAVNLIWKVHQHARYDLVETVASEMLSMRSSVKETREAYNRFGVLWRYTDDACLSSTALRTPLVHILTGLSCEDSALRQIVENWLRMYPKSYIRLIETILIDVVDSDLQCKPTTYESKGRVLRLSLYEKIIDQQRHAYALNLLLNLLNFTGPGLAKSLEASNLKKVISPTMLTKAQEAGLVVQDSTCMDLLMNLLTRYVECEPLGNEHTSGSNVLIQSKALDILLYLVSHGDLKPSKLEQIQAPLISKLYFLVHEFRLELQAKLLHVLHSVTYAMAASQSKKGYTGHPSNGELRSYDRLEDSTNASHVDQNQLLLSPLLLQTIQDGLQFSYFQPLYQYWLEFVLAAVPLHKAASVRTLLPLIECLASQVTLAAQELDDVADNNATMPPSTTNLNEADITMVLNTLEKMALFLLNQLSDARDDLMVTLDDREQPTPESAGLFGIVSTVFSSEVTLNSEKGTEVTPNPSFKVLLHSTRAFYKACRVTIAHGTQTGSSNNSLDLIGTRTWMRARKALEQLFRLRKPDVFAILIDIWYRSSSAAGETRAYIFIIVDLLAASLEEVIELCSESIARRLITLRETSPPIWQPELHYAVFAFLEEYLSRLEGPLIMQAWSHLQSLVKDVLANAALNKYHVLSMLRCTIAIGEKLVQVGALEVKKARKEFQDTFLKLLDATASISGKGQDQSSWLRAGPKELTENTGISSPPSRIGTPSRQMNDTQFGGSKYGVSLALQVNHFISTRAIPSMSKFFLESEKVSTACTNLVYYIIAPEIRNNSGNLGNLDSSVLEVLEEISKFSNAARAWRGIALEAFNDSKFFVMKPDMGKKWKNIINSLHLDKQAFAELLNRVSTAPPTAIFSNRESEIVSKTMSLRRVSVAIFVADTNHYVNHLPAIQEKLVDLLKSGMSPVMHSEVYLCMRILLCRLSAHSIAGIWPVILTDLLATLQELLSNPPQDNSDALSLVLAVCKFLDLAITLETTEFQIHQWMFITDTVDAIYPPDEWRPEALLDQASEIVNSVAHHNSIHAITPANSWRDKSRRRPLLIGVDKVSTIADLGPFFSHVSLASYESLYSTRGEVDVEAVESSIWDDLFIGR